MTIQEAISKYYAEFGKDRRVSGYWEGASADYVLFVESEGGGIIDASFFYVSSNGIRAVNPINSPIKLDEKTRKRA